MYFSVLNNVLESEFEVPALPRWILSHPFFKVFRRRLLLDPDLVGITHIIFDEVHQSRTWWEVTSYSVDFTWKVKEKVRLKTHLFQRLHTGFWLLTGSQYFQTTLFQQLPPWNSNWCLLKTNENPPKSLKDSFRDNQNINSLPSCTRGPRTG